MGGRGSGSFIETTAGNRSGIKSKRKMDKTALKRHTEQINRLETGAYEDGTYNLDTLEQISYDYGYQVTFCQIGDNYTADEYADKCNEFIAVSSDGVVSAGKFEGTPEVSFHVSDLNIAVSLAKKYNQISIWDWAGIDEIGTGGTGKREQ